jgi:hypothetical protein
MVAERHTILFSGVVAAADLVDLVIPVRLGILIYAIIGHLVLLKAS